MIISPWSHPSSEAGAEPRLESEAQLGAARLRPSLLPGPSPSITSTAPDLAPSLAHILSSEEIIQSCHASAKWTVDRHLVTNREVVTWKYFIVQTDCFPDKILQRIVSVQWLRRWMFTNNKDIVWQGYYFW